MDSTRVLIVDDERDFAEALSERMQSRGLHADTAFCGEDAVALVKEHKYDAIILDLAMPGMDGIATLKAMLTINPDLQVVILTGRATVSTGVEAVKEGAFELLQKPVKFDDLIGKIKQARSRSLDLSEAKMNEMIDEITKRRGW